MFIGTILKTPVIKSFMTALKGASKAYGYAIVSSKYGMTIPEIQLYKETCKNFERALPIYFNQIKSMGRHAIAVLA